MQEQSASISPKRPDYVTPQALEDFVSRSLAEDIGTGDVTTQATLIGQGPICLAELKIKQDGVLAGVEMARLIFHYVSPEIKIDVHIEDGASVRAGEVGFTVEARAAQILTAERLVLNTMQRMSGIATLTAKATSRIAHTRCRLLDTRKTTPLFRMAEKWAVAIGGGVNHRYGLYDAILIKDNHIDYAGGIIEALDRVERYVSALDREKMPIICEVRTITELEALLAHSLKIDRVLLDNMTPDKLSEALGIIRGHVVTEASGGITFENLVPYAETGVDYISMGALTHSASILDLSLKAK